jgi:hypothetical protein
VESIRSGPLSGNAKTKQELEAKLSELAQSLQHAGSLAWVAAAYSRTNENVLDLLHRCQRADRFLRDNMDKLADGQNHGYQSAWQLMDNLFESISESRDVPRTAMLDRSRWYDEDDRAKIDLRLRDFSIAYERANQAVSVKAARDARRELQGMIEPLADVETLLEDTIYEKVLRTLQQLAA